MSTRPSVMVVDDEEELANLFRTFLERSGFNSVSFTDPLSALDHYSQNRNKYSIVITDWRMPNLDGIQLAKKIREYNTTVKILLMTAHVVEESTRKELLRDTLLVDVIEKPFRLKDLVPRIEELC
ncbi:MAG: response regulator [Nitrososphaerales archaeon]